jgi:hypothetical protein
VNPADVIALLDAERPMFDAMIEEAVSDAVDDRLGVVRDHATPDEAATGILEAVATFHARDLAHAEERLPAALDERLGGGVRDVPEVLRALDDVVRADGGANAAALTALDRGLREAVRLATGERDRRVKELLDGERDRLAGRERSRVRRAVENLKAAVALPDEALDAPRRPGASIVEVPTA